MRVERTLRSASGASLWDRGRGEWVVYLNRIDSWRRQRFTLFHEFKHIIDHGHRHVLYAGPGHYDPDVEAERAADYFAGCVLVPKKFLKRAWGTRHSKGGRSGSPIRGQRSCDRSPAPPNRIGRL